MSKNKFCNKEKRLRVAAIQMCSSHIIDDNLHTVSYYVQEAAKNKAKLIVLPEMFAFIEKKKLAKSPQKKSAESSKILFHMEKLAKQYKLWIVAGTIPISCNLESKVRAASCVFNEKGNIVARYDKIHLFDVVLSKQDIYKESESIEAGDKLVVVDTPLGRIGLAVCYDVRFPELFRCLVNRGAEIIVLPSAFTLETGTAHWEILARSRAIENFCYFIGANQGGLHANGKETYGHSLIVDPWGRVIAKKEGQCPGVIYADINLYDLHKIRKTFPVLCHQKNFILSSHL